MNVHANGNGLSTQAANRSGLSTAQARARLAEFGANELPRQRRRGFARILLGVLAEPMFLLLVRLLASERPWWTQWFVAGQRAFWVIAALVTLVIASSIAVPGLAAAFGFAPPAAAHLGVVLLASCAGMAVLNGCKRLPWVRRTLAVTVTGRA